MSILDATQSSTSSPWLCCFTLPALAQIVNLPNVQDQRRAFVHGDYEAPSLPVAGS